MSKWVSHHLAVGRMMAFRKARDSTCCPRCKAPHENTLHVLRCRHKSSRKQWRRGIREIEQWMESSKTEPTLSKALVSTLRQFNKPGNFDSFVPHNLPRALRSCFQSQAEIGWTGFLEGLLSLNWAVYQGTHFERISSRRSGQRWAVELSKKIWKLVFSMWDHRNNALFSEGTIDTMSGIDKVRAAIARERQIGLGNLDLSFAPYFTLPTSSFTKMKPINLRRWFSLIRKAREAQGHEYQDEFTSSAALRDWIGLTVLPEHLFNQQQQMDQHRQQAQLRRIRTGYRD